MGKKVYDNPTDKLSALPDLDDKLSGLPDLVDGGTTPAEKKNEKPATVSPVGGGSSDLLSVKFGGEDYEVNPTTQEVFKGGKPVTVPQNIKDYIATNIIGVEPVKETGAVGSNGKPMQPIGATGAATPSTIADKVTAQQIRRGAGGGEEIRVEFTPQQQAKIEAIGLNPDQFRNSPLNEDFQKLAKQFAPNVDFGDEKQVDQLLDDYQAFSAINKADNLSKELNIPRKQLSQVMKDQAAEAFLDVPEQAIYDIDKKRDEAVAKGATPEELKKIDEDRNKAVDFVLSKVDADIVNLNKAKAFPNLTPEEIAKIDNEIANKKASYNNLTKKPSQIIQGVLKANPSLNLLDKKFQGLDDKQRLGLLYDGILADLYTTGRDLGFSLTDIKNGKIDISTFFGYGEKGKKFVNLYNQAQQLAPAVLINKAPDARQDTFLDTFSNSFLGGLSPAMGANTTTEQQKGVIISDFLDRARVEPSEETAKNLGQKLDDYGLGGAFWGQAVGGSAAAGASIALAEFGLGPIFSGMKASRYLAPIVDLMEGTKLGRAVRTGIGYEAAGRVLPASSGETDFMSGFVGEWATLLPVKFKGLAVPIAKLFGDQADKAAKIIGDFVKRGVGEMGQETAQSLYQIYRDTPAGQSVFDGIKQQFGEPSEALKFAISTFLMGGAMGGGSDLGMHRANVDAVKNLTPDEKTIYDTFTGEQRKKANADIIDIAKEQVAKVPTDNLEAQADNTQEAITKLQSVAPDQDYSVEVDGIKYEGNNAEDLQSDIDYLKQLNGIVNDELYKRNTGQTETPPIAEADQGDVELAKPEAGVGVEGEIDKRISDLEGILADDATTKQETGSGNLQDRQAVLDELNELKKRKEAIAKVDEKGKKDTSLSKDIENKKADIEKRRTDDLNSIKIKIVNEAPVVENGKITIDTSAIDNINAKYDAELAALETTEILPQEGVTEPTKAPVIKAQVVGTTAGLNTIIDGGLGKQQDPRFTGEVQQGKSIFKVNPNNNESSFLDISLPSSDSFGRSGGVQIRFELPNGVDANTVFEAVKKEAAKLGRLDAKDPDFKSKVQGLVDKGIAEIQGLATGGAKQAAQVKETVSEKQVPPTETSENPALKNVASTATALSKLDKGTIDATLPMQPLEIDGYKREYRTDSPLSIAEAYHKAKADGSNPDLVKAVEELLAPKGEVKAEPSVKAETTSTEKVEAEPTADIDNVADKAGIAPKKAKKAAIQSDVIDKLVGNAANRREAYKEIADENIKEVAKIITDTNGKFDKVMDAIDNNDQLLADLEKKLGIKKICRI